MSKSKNDNFYSTVFSFNRRQSVLKILNNLPGTLYDLFVNKNLFKSLDKGAGSSKIFVRKVPEPCRQLTGIDKIGSRYRFPVANNMEAIFS